MVWDNHVGISSRLASICALGLGFEAGSDDAGDAGRTVLLFGAYRDAN
jgi:hypothetical protein